MPSSPRVFGCDSSVAFARDGAISLLFESPSDRTVDVSSMNLARGTSFELSKVVHGVEGCTACQDIAGHYHAIPAFSFTSPPLILKVP